MSSTAPLLGGSSGNGGTSAATFQGVSFDARPVRDNKFRICYLAISALAVISVAVAGATANFSGHKDFNSDHDKWQAAQDAADPWNNDGGNSVEIDSDDTVLSNKNVEIFVGLFFGFVVAAFGAGLLWIRFLVAHARTMTWFSVGILVGSLWISALSCLFAGVLIGAVIMGLIAALVTGFVYWRRSTIELTAELLRTASRALLDHTAIVWTNLGMILVGFFTLVFASAGYYFASITGEASIDNITGEPIWTPASYASGLQTSIGLGFTFTQFVLTTMSTFLTAGVVSLWYFHRDDLNRMPAAPVSKVLAAAVGPQLGSIAFAAFILWVIETLRDMQRNAAKQQKNVAVLCLLCILGLIENFIKFITTFAVITASITGSDFMTSAKTSFEMFGRRGIDMITVDSFGSLVLQLTAFFTAVLLGLLAALLGKMAMDDPETLLLVILGIIVFFASLIVFIPYVKMCLAAVDTCFTCYVIDQDMNTVQNGENGNSELKAIMDEKLATRRKK